MTRRQGPQTVDKLDSLRAAFAGALGSTRLEGVEPEPFVHEYVDRVLAGEMTLDEAITKVKVQYQQR